MIGLISLAQAALGLGSWELLWWGRRRARRRELYDRALAHARRLGVPLVVVGAPDCGPTEGPGCGDLCIDIQRSRCPNFIQADICRRLPLDDDSCVVFVSCVLEYVSDYEAAKRELRRISGGRIYVARVEPWTMTAHVYPGTKRLLPAEIEDLGARALAPQRTPALLPAPTATATTAATAPNRDSLSGLGAQPYRWHACREIGAFTPVFAGWIYAEPSTIELLQSGLFVLPWEGPSYRWRRVLPVKPVFQAEAPVRWAFLDAQLALDLEGSGKAYREGKGSPTWAHFEFRAY